MGSKVSGLYRRVWDGWGDDDEESNALNGREGDVQRPIFILKRVRWENGLWASDYWLLLWLFGTFFRLLILLLYFNIFMFNTFTFVTSKWLNV